MKNNSNKKTDSEKILNHTCNYTSFNTSSGIYYKCSCGNIKFTKPYSNRN